MNMTKLTCAIAIVFAVTTTAIYSYAQSPSITDEELSSAISRAFGVLKTGAKNYPEHRSCFSCHHQTLPLLALSLHGRKDVADEPTEFLESKAVSEIIQFTEESFVGKRQSMLEGHGVGGGSLTVGYGLWVMDLAGTPRNETIDAMVEYLLKAQADDGGWNFQSVRPPAASSRAMTAAIAVYGLRAYGDSESQKDRVASAFARAKLWSQSFESAPSQEDLVGQIWLSHQLEDRERVSSLVESLWRLQNEDGGWGQTADMESDAYATGQALLMIVQTAGKDASHSLWQKTARGVEYLLKTQKADGSWHVATRANPVQVYFDNGDPHGKDQFISMMATAWASAAIANHESQGKRPLESFRFALRVLH
jgi:N-acyl-D-amino-acid deacylase